MNRQRTIRLENKLNANSQTSIEVKEKLLEIESDDELKEPEPLMAGPSHKDYKCLLGDVYPTFPDQCQSYLAKYCTREVFDKLQQNDAKGNYPFAKAIFPGFKLPDQKFGVFAGGPESYKNFSDLFDPIINEHHKTDCSQKIELKTMQEVVDNDVIKFVGSLNEPSSRWQYFDQTLIKNVRIEAVRNLDKLPTLAGLTKTSAKTLFETQKKIFNALNAAPEFKGKTFTQAKESEVYNVLWGQLIEKGFMIE